VSSVWFLFLVTRGDRLAQRLFLVIFFLIHLCNQRHAEMQMEGTMFTPSLAGMKHVKSESGVILTKPFLQVCKQILPVLGKREMFCMELITDEHY